MPDNYHSDNPEQERERQIREHRQRLRQAGSERCAPRVSPHPQPSPQETALKRAYK